MIQSAEKHLHLVGIGVTHSIAFEMHNYIAKSLGLPWTFHSTECPSIDDVLDLARNPSTAGLVVTMPYKNAILPLLDDLDELSTAIGACNNVYYDTSGGMRRSIGTNTDWAGIKGCLMEHGDETASANDGRPVSALIVGAGGACRAAVYALSSHLHCTTIYVLNRDDQEVVDLIHDSQKLPIVAKIVHVKTRKQLQDCQSPYYIVGTVPDFEPQSDAEKNVAALLKLFLERPKPGILLDMCFKPRQTRMIKLAQSLGWSCVEGTHVIGYQIELQWRLWAGEDCANRLDKDGSWKTLLQAAEKSKFINF